MFTPTNDENPPANQLPIPDQDLPSSSSRIFPGSCFDWAISISSKSFSFKFETKIEDNSVNTVS